MPVSAKIIADSINPAGDRLTSFVIEYPRFILAEINTHRMLSRSTASSRAIPIKKRIKDILNNPVVPKWGLDKPGMQANEEVPQETIDLANAVWENAIKSAIESAEALMGLGIHKQSANRLLEPFCHASTIISGTEWSNFFSLRWHPDAQPEFRELAEAMRVAFVASIPEPLQWGGWHLPFITKEEKNDGHPSRDLAKWSTARCARVSYNNHDGTNPNPEKDLELHEKLLGKLPVHASPAEMPAFSCRYGGWGQDLGCDHGNYRGFHQYRKMIPGENIKEFPWEGFESLVGEK